MTVILMELIFMTSVVKSSVKKNFDLFTIALFFLSIVFIYFIVNDILADHSDTRLLVFSSSLFWLFVICYIITALSIRQLFFKKLSQYLKPFQQLEQWASLSTSQSEAFVLATALQNNKDNISQAILILLEQLQQTHNSDNQYTQKIRENILLDSDTGIGNRQFFSNRLEALLKHDSVQGAVFIIQFMDGNIENTNEHSQSSSYVERLITAIQYRLKSKSQYFIARQSEFELALLLPGIYLSDTEKLANRLLSNLMAVSLPKVLNNEVLIHIGISYFSEKHKPYQIMAEADMALRSAQLQGPSQWFMYDQGEIARERVRGSLSWRTFLAKVIKQRKLMTFLQPVMASNSKDVLHYETLSKLTDDDGSLISARIFIPMARKCALIQALDLLACEKLLQVMLTRTEKNYYSINLSIESLLSEQFINDFLDKIAIKPELAELLIIEVSEYHLVSNLVELLPIFEKITAKGIKLLADKVGQYVVNANYLKTCPISYIKLHRSIVLNIDEKLENQVFIQSLNALCIFYHVEIYALGIESPQEWKTLLRLGVTGGQGHYFSEAIAQHI
ncbi:MAG: RNase E specificity factor CsrD [Alteromonadaceae bacterium]|jgi:RNase E specificity factor CsrD